jgi:signal transduction histidine kinase
MTDQIGTMNRLRVDLAIDDAERLGETAQVALYTIVRELLDQAVRRGPPTRVGVVMTAAADGSFRTCVSDDAEPERRLRSYEAASERVKQLHGKIEVEAGSNGTSVSVTLPSYASRR